MLCIIVHPGQRNQHRSKPRDTVTRDDNRSNDSSCLGQHDIQDERKFVIHQILRKKKCLS